MANLASKSVQHPPSAKHDAGTVPLKTHYTKDVFTRLQSFAKAKGLMNEQDVIRLAVVAFLEKNGY